MNGTRVGGTVARESRTQSVRIGLLGIVALLASMQHATAASAKPEIFGIWIGIGAGRPDIDPRWRNKPYSPTPEFTEWGAAESRQLGRLGTELGTPGECDPPHPGQFMASSGLFPLQVLQGSNQIVIMNEWVAVPRRIYLDGRDHTSAFGPTWQGHSIGHWEGEVLVVDTVGLNGRTRPLNGYAANAVNATPESAKAPRLPASDQMHIEERIRLVGDGDFLEVTMTFTDPKTYLRPFTSTGYLERRPDIDMQEYLCRDNVRTSDEGHTSEVKAP